MSVLGEYPETISNKNDLQIWNNSAFDDGNNEETEGFHSYNNQIKSPSWLVKKPVAVNFSSESSFSSKENISPNGFSVPNPNSSVLVQQTKFINNQPLKLDLLKSESNVEKTYEEIEIENEIRRLFAKLESIRAEKAKKNAEKNVEKQRKTEENMVKDSRNKIQRRGFSLGPNEIMDSTNSKWKQSGTTPIQSNSTRRKSCFWKLDDIEEEKCGISRIKNPGLRQAVTSIGAKKGVKKDDSVLGSIQPKKLFGEQSVPAKKPMKPGRVVASRYNQPMKKRENVEQKLNSVRVKKKWDIPSVRLSGDENEEVVVMEEVLLPRIRVVRCVEDSGRDSGRAKRVAELVGKKSYFDEVEEEVCQKLSFDEV